jgi:adenylosuccinate synthase
MTNYAVIGMGFGDEGKGVATEYLCSKQPKDSLVVRFSGGHQAGHKVIKDGVEHIFSSFGSGTLSGCPTYWSRNCTLEPVAFLNERRMLLAKGVEPKIYIDRRCPITTPYDVYANRNSVELEHGTTGTGFGKTIMRQLNGLSFVVADLATTSLVKEKIQSIKRYYGIEKEISENIFFEAIEHFYHMCVSGQINLVGDLINIKNNVVFEGSQGLMLDPKIGYMPHCTPSDITPMGIYDLGHDIDELFLITRCYQTRHGNGPMTNEDKPVVLKNNEKETNKCGGWQGEFRTSVLDVDQLVYAKHKGIDGIIRSGTKISLAMTCMDQMDEYTATYNDRMIRLKDKKEFAKTIGNFLNIQSIYINDSPYSHLKLVEDNGNN